MTDRPALPDVRMKGFTQRSTVEAAWAWLETQLPPIANLPTERLPLPQAAGRILASEVRSAVNVPGFAKSMMDGYAVRADETQGATPYNPISFRIAGTSLPGQPTTAVPGPGEAIRIMTGAPLPTACDAVVPAEYAQVVGLGVEIAEPVSPGKNVAQPGEDVPHDDVVLPAGRRLRPQDLGVLSSIGVGHVDVIRPPRVRLLISGNELLPAGTRPVGFQVADANGPMLGALVERDGGTVLQGPIVADNPETLRAVLDEPAEIVLVSGGSSVGQEDHAPRLIAELGHLAIHGIAMRPSSPAGMGTYRDRLVFLLPGNPVSCLCAYDFFAGRAIRHFAGRPLDWPYLKQRLPLARKLVSTVGRVDYARVCVVGGAVEPLAISGAGVLSSTTRADGFVIIPADLEGYPPGAEVDVYFYDR